MSKAQLYDEIMLKIKGILPIDNICEKFGKIWCNDGISYAGQLYKLEKAGDGIEISLGTAFAVNKCKKFLGLERCCFDRTGKIKSASSELIETVTGKRLNYVSTDNGHSVAQVAENARKNIYRHNPEAKRMDYAEITYNRVTNRLKQLGL